MTNSKWFLAVVCLCLIVLIIGTMMHITETYIFPIVTFIIGILLVPVSRILYFQQHHPPWEMDFYTKDSTSRDWKQQGATLCIPNGKRVDVRAILRCRDETILSRDNTFLDIGSKRPTKRLVSALGRVIAFRRIPSRSGIENALSPGPEHPEDLRKAVQVEPYTFKDETQCREVEGIEFKATNAADGLRWCLNYTPEYRVPENKTIDLYFTIIGTVPNDYRRSCLMRAIKRRNEWDGTIEFQSDVSRNGKTLGNQRVRRSLFIIDSKQPTKDTKGARNE
jgi:hypothetical protein